MKDSDLLGERLLHTKTRLPGRRRSTTRRTAALELPEQVGSHLASARSWLVVFLLAAALQDTAPKRRVVRIVKVEAAFNFIENDGLVPLADDMGADRIEAGDAIEPAD